VTARTAPPLSPDLVAGLKRLKLARIRAMAPETLQQAKTQRWTPEELLRTFVEAEIAARDAANQRLRRKAAGFPVHKSLEEFKVTASSVPQATFDYLASLEWVRRPPGPLPHRRRAGRGPLPGTGRQLRWAGAGPAAA